MAYTTINKSTEHFNTTLHTGNGSTQSITGVGFQPDLTWIKRRSADGWHWFTDAVRGTTKTIYSNTTTAEETNTNGLTAFGTDGFTVGSAADINGNTQTHVAWNWKANGAGSTNYDGDITSTVSANTTAGFSIVSYTGSGTASDTVGHGLGVTPAMIIVKNRTEATSWCVAHKSLSTDKVLRLEGTNAEGDIGDGELDSPPNNSSTFGFNNGTSGTPLKVVNESSDNYIAYCFAEKKGFSKFGSYTGNGSTNGTFVYTGFKPAFLIAKRTNAASSWGMWDSKRDPTNQMSKALFPDLSNAEGTDYYIDFLSNGFKWRLSGSGENGSGSTYIYMAFGQSIVGSNNIPATAR